MTENRYTREDEESLRKSKSPSTEEKHDDHSTKSTVTVRELTIYQALRAHRPAVFWSVMVCLCAVMDGYDTILIPSFFAYPAFAEKFGTFDTSSGTYQLTAAWQAALGNSGGIGAFFGVMANGYLVSWWGHKKVLLGALLALSSLITITFLAENVQVLFMGECLCGVLWGIFNTIAPAYSSEILPLSLRVYLTTFTNMCYIIGQLFAASALEGLLYVKDSWSYRCALALQWFWPILIFPILLFMPESPWRLVRLGKMEEAEETLTQLLTKRAPVDVKETLDMIIRTNAIEERLLSGMSYLDCFRGTERRRTEIACMSIAGQMLSGLIFAYNATYFYQQVGLSTKNIYKLNIGSAIVSFSATLICWFFIMPYVGRRKIYLYGMAGMTLILFFIGFLSLDKSQAFVPIFQISLILLWIFTFHLSIGQLGWAIPAEVGSTRLRQKTICVARNAFYLVNFAGKAIEPYFMNPTKLNLKGFTAFFWAGTALLTFVWVYYRLPEIKNRTFEDLDILFSRKVPTRQFSTCQIERSKDGEAIIT